ncbi:MAG: hypothetical protein PHD48_01335 [Alphaproteobacteria bacterium]|nr:hypothetical protein [Alphaproteobacteria bacterium]
MEQLQHNYPLSNGPSPLFTKTVIDTLDVMGAVLSLRGQQKNPYADIIVPSLFLISPADRTLITQLHDSRNHIERVSCELVSLNNRATFTCPNEKKVVDLLVAVMVETAHEVIGGGTARNPQQDIREPMNLYRLCAHNLVDMHLNAALRVKPTVAPTQLVL